MYFISFRLQQVKRHIILQLILHLKQRNGSDVSSYYLLIWLYCIICYHCYTCVQEFYVLHHLLPLLHLCTRVLYLPEEWLMLLLFLILYCQPLLFNILYSIIYIYYLSVLQKVFKRQATSFLLDHIDTKAVLKGTLHKVVLHCL